jgi:excisionase family DNA binding protein
MAEAARAVGVNRSTIYRLYKDGRLTVQPGARSLLVSKTEVAALLWPRVSVQAPGGIAFGASRAAWVGGTSAVSRTRSPFPKDR